MSIDNKDSIFNRGDFDYNEGNLKKSLISLTAKNNYAQTPYQLLMHRLNQNNPFDSTQSDI